MSEIILSDYFYGDESEQFIYFRIPRLLITSPRFKHLSTDAKLLYGLLLNAGTDGTVQEEVPPCGNLAGGAGQ